MTFDLIVIGGGPAGASAAITAAREGCSVLLLERGRFPRHKVCGEFVSPESLSLLRWLLGESSQSVISQSLALSRSRLFLDGRCLQLPIAPPAASITRYDLDCALWEAAQRAGVTALEGTAAQPVNGTHSFRVNTAAGDFYGRALINASGRWSNLSRSGKGTKQSRWLGFKAHFRGAGEPSVDLYFFKDGYCGVQPVRADGGATLLNVCALCRTSVPATWEEIFSRHPVLEARSREWRPEFSPVSTFPIMFQAPRPVSENTFNVGDAAGFVDPFVGDGISLALRSGNLAARCALSFLRGHSSLDSALEFYRRDYNRCLRPVYAASSLLRAALKLPRTMRAPLLFACERAPRIGQYLLGATRSPDGGVG